MLKSLVSHFYPKMHLTCTILRNASRLSPKPTHLPFIWYDRYIESHAVQWPMETNKAAPFRGGPSDTQFLMPTCVCPQTRPGLVRPFLHSAPVHQTRTQTNTPHLAVLRRRPRSSSHLQQPCDGVNEAELSSVEQTRSLSRVDHVHITHSAPASPVHQQACHGLVPA